ncbi:NF-X1-type zinc finger protein NFXL1 [Tanacetum coccineum]
MFGEDAYQNCLVDKNRFDIRRFNSSQISSPTTSIDQVVDMSRERIGNGNDRRQPRNYRRQEWIPRGSTPSIPPPPLDTTNININTPFTSNSNLDANHHHPPNNRSHNVSKSHFIPSTRGRGSGVVNHQHQQNMNIVNANDSNRRKGESLLPHLFQEIQDKLLKGSIECMICYDMVRRTTSIWLCSSCYSIFHLHCIKKWARAPTSIDLSAQKNQGFNWRCPGCQSVQLTSSKDIRYLCFCGNRQDPPSDLYLTPHSCGEPCGRPLDKDHRVGNHDDDDRDDGRCHHRCVVQCHPGPCPPCKAFAPPRICPCGKKTIPTRCSNQKSLLTCGQRCGKPLKCLRHCCSKTCHVGPCDSCDVQIDASCFCKKKIEVVVCGDMAVKRHAKVEHDGIFSCNSSCGKLLGVETMTVECFNTTTTMTNGADTAFKCDKPCGRNKNYGRHHCIDKCCPLSNSKNSAATQGWDLHLCSKPCEKKLRCWQHDCETLCHSGHCPPCQEMIFTDLTCACGRSSIPPPLPCGTPPPSCQYPCSVPQPCGHPSSHSCHFGDCPPCSVPILKECIGGHVVLRNIPCGSKDIRCNKLCGKTRQCGMHTCLRTCHPSPCDSSSSSSGGSTFGVKALCGQTCGAPRRDCRHTCTSLCHPHNTCSDVRCEFPVTIPCSYGRITATVPCDARGSNNSGYNVDTVLEASVVQKLPVPLQPVEVNGKKIPLGQRKLTCDDECSNVECKKVLADAFGVDTNLEALHFCESSAVSDMLGDLFRRDPKWVLSVEERCKMLVLGRGRSGGTIKVYVFYPMVKEKRDAVRLYADIWKLSVHATGWEPKRFIVVHVTPKSKAPSRILGAKGLNPSNLIHPPSFDPLVDVDPRLVVALFDLPGDADVSALVLRFGGECELVWLNDKNALAVFSDPARAATALRWLDHGSVYHGAVVLSTNGTSSTRDHSNSWSVAHEWVNPETSPWKIKEGPLITTSSANRWSILEPEVGSSQESGKVLASNILFENEPSLSSTSSSNAAAALKTMMCSGGRKKWEKHMTDLASICIFCY